MLQPAFGPQRAEDKFFGVTEIMANPISILLVDDIAEVRENVKKLLAFEQDFDVIGSSGSGREGIKMARELRPDIIIMDINMPDVDGITAAQEVKKHVPTTGVIMMSVNSDRDYLRRAMAAGASDFLTKPANMDDLYMTIRNVYKNMKPIRDQYERMSEAAASYVVQEIQETEGDRAGHILTCYSPKGGVGTTTIAISLASALMGQTTKVLLIDADVQFGDVGVSLNLQAQSTLSDIIENASDLDVDYFENILVTHPSGIKVLLPAARPELAETVYANPAAVTEIINQVRYHYDFIIIDTSSRLDDLILSMCELATAVIMITTPTLPAVRNARFVLDLFDQFFEGNQNKVKIVLSQVHEEKRGQQRMTISQEKIANFLRKEVYAVIPSDEKPILQAIIKGIPVVAADRSADRSPMKELNELAQKLRLELTGEEDNVAASQNAAGSKSSGFPNLFGGR